MAEDQAYYRSKYTGSQIDALLDKVNDGNVGGAGKSPYIGTNGNWYEWNEDLNDYADTGTPATGPQGPAGADGAIGPKGPKGDTGETGPAGPQGPRGLPGAVGNDGRDGEDGVSIVSVRQTTTSGEDNGLNRITVTLDNGATSVFTVKNGSKGSQGEPGATGPQGNAGFSPSAKVEQISTGARITITDANGTTTAEVYNGTSGAGGSGENGVTFTPTVSSDGVISWTNDGGLSNPTPVNIKGPKGDKGDAPVRGTDYWTAADIAEIKGYVDDAILGGAW